MTEEKKSRQNRNTKYPFNKTEVNGSFKIKALDYNSMLTSLRKYNERHGLSISVKKDYVTSTMLLITRVS